MLHLRAMDSTTRRTTPLIGTVRAYWLASIICMASFLFGYDSGIVGGVVGFASFAKDYHFTPQEATRDTSLVVSLQQLGAFVGCFLIWPITSRFGRRRPLSASAFVFVIGATIETINTHSLPAFYVGRVIAGVGGAGMYVG